MNKEKEIMTARAVVS